MSASEHGGVVNNPPASLVGHITTKVKAAISLWPSSGSGWTEYHKQSITTDLVDLLLKHPEYSINNKVLSATGTKLCKALAVLDYRLITEGGASLAELFQKYDARLQSNQTIFDDITNHHTQISAEKWADVAANETSLSVYSTAAAAMGTKTWVAECNHWMQSFAHTYFRNGGARKHYLRSHISQSADSLNSNAKRQVELQKDMMISATGADAARIRLLDVGSCYNPLAKSEADVFEVTALDLYPADPSVYQCDFLNIAIGSEGTAPVVENRTQEVDDALAAKFATTATAHKRAVKKQRLSEDCVQATPAEVVDPVSSSAESHQSAPGHDASANSAKLIQLPAASFDVVTMSLVLNYLPTPAQRLQMVRNARALLVSPTAADQPHRNGLFIIAEKQSIFRSPHAMRAAEKVSSNAGNTGVESTSREGAEGKEQDLWTCWVKSICACGFELVKYHYFPTTDGRKSHMLAFATVGSIPPVDECTVDKECQLWIKQDFEPK